MCGIIGTTDFRISDDLLNEALLLMNRRGPDFSGRTKDNGVHFGHNRLSILDLEERSNQPFKYNFGNQSLLLVFNGEIYNFLFLKEQLILKGYVFNTRSDTEIIAASFFEWGNNCFDHFVGMWAIAIKIDDTIVLSRDRVGKKPLYYTLSNENNLSFSSSLRSLSHITGENSVSKDGLELYFALGFTPKKYSIIQNISKLEPGHTLIFTQGEFGVELSENLISKPLSFYDFRNFRFEEILKLSVKLRIVSDVPIATLMSGGVDSTIVSVLTKSLKNDIESYFVDFDDRTLSERKWADYLSKRNSISLTRVFMNNEELVDAFKEYYDAYEEPFADYSGIPSIAIFKKISNKYKVVLTGDGGDELFFGYPHYLKKYIIYKCFGILKLFSKMKFIPYSLNRIVGDKKDHFESNYLKNHGIVTEFSSNLINEEFNSSIANNNGFLRGVINYDRVFYNWPEKYLVKIDRASMYSSIEVRSPFLDEDLSKKVESIPILFLFTPYLKKLYLKLTYFNIFGLKYFTAKKNGFTPPIEKLRNEYFSNEDFNYSRGFIKEISLNLYEEMLAITFDDLRKDKILFDRFFFFNEWLKKFKDFCKKEDL